MIYHCDQFFSCHFKFKLEIIFSIRDKVLQILWRIYFIWILSRDWSFSCYVIMLTLIYQKFKLYQIVNISWILRKKKFERGKKELNCQFLLSLFLEYFLASATKTNQKCFLVDYKENTMKSFEFQLKGMLAIEKRDNSLRGVSVLSVIRMRCDFNAWALALSIARINKTRYSSTKHWSYGQLCYGVLLRENESSETLYRFQSNIVSDYRMNFNPASKRKKVKSKIFIELLALFSVALQWIASKFFLVNIKFF